MAAEKKKTNIDHLPDRLGFKSEAASRFPSVILIASSSPCNLKCPGCPCTILPTIRKTVNPEGRPEHFFRLEYFRAIVDECKTYKTDDFIPRIRMSGYGEPLLNKAQGDMAEYSGEHGVPTSLITNGQLLTRETSERLIAAGLESIEISADAHKKELYESIRVGGDFFTLERNVSDLIAVRNEIQPDKKTVIIVSVVKNPKNQAFVEEIEAFWKDLGVDRVSVRKFLTWGLPQLSEMQEKMGNDTYLTAEAPCPCPYERLMVDPAGWIRLCPYDDQKKIPPFGHMSTTTIAEAWRSERFNKIRSCHQEQFNPRQAVTDAQLCVNCEDRMNRSWTYNYLSIVDKKNT